MITGLAHCGFCHCPVEQWEPMATYQSDRSCEFYNDVHDAAWDLEEQAGTGKVSFKALLRRCRAFKGEYPDIPDFNSAVMECFNILEDCGVINYRGVKA